LLSSSISLSVVPLGERYVEPWVLPDCADEDEVRAKAKDNTSGRFTVLIRRFYAG
jgi:hypothetical protein